jgi:hypothetical protein
LIPESCQCVEQVDVSSSGGGRRSFDRVDVP